MAEPRGMGHQRPWDPVQGSSSTLPQFTSVPSHPAISHPISSHLTPSHPNHPTLFQPQSISTSWATVIARHSSRYWDILVYNTHTKLNNSEYRFMLLSFSAVFPLPPLFPPSLPHFRSSFTLNKINGPRTSLKLHHSLGEDLNWLLFVS
jgi:hypothetical protein